MGLKFYKGTAAEYNAKKDKISEGGLIVTKENNSSQTGNLYINDNGTHVQLSSNKAFTDITLAGNTLTGVALDGSSKAVTLPSMTVDSTFSTTSTNAVQNKIVTAKINTMEGNIGTNATNIITNTNNIAQNTSDIAQHTADIAQNLAAIAIASDNISGLNAIVESEKGKLSTAQTDIDNLQKAVSNLQAKDTELSNKDAALQNAINKNAGDIAEHAETLTSLANQDSSLLEKIEQNADDIATNADELSQRVDKIVAGNVQVESAKKADIATEAIHATNADEATHAESANTAVQANQALVASEAHYAAQAGQAAQANSATNAEHATTADNATNADEAKHANTATTAEEAEHASAADFSSEAEKANSLNLTEASGSSIKPVYFTADGIPAPITHSIEASVPANAQFTDTISTIASTSGSGNAVTGISVDNVGQFTVVKGNTFALDSDLQELITALTWTTV